MELAGLPLPRHGYVPAAPRAGGLPGGHLRADGKTGAGPGRASLRHRGGHARRHHRRCPAGPQRQQLSWPRWPTAKTNSSAQHSSTFPLASFLSAKAMPPPWTSCCKVSGPPKSSCPRAGCGSLWRNTATSFTPTRLEDWIFTYDFAREKLLNHFHTLSLKGFGVEELELGQTAAGAALHYLAATENNKLAHIGSLSRLQTEKYVWLDRFTIRNLELVASNHENGVSLLQVLDKTVSPMGARLLKKWVLLPLTSRTQINERQDSGAVFCRKPAILRRTGTAYPPHRRPGAPDEQNRRRQNQSRAKSCNCAGRLVAIEQIKKLLSGTNAPRRRPGWAAQTRRSAEPLPDPPRTHRKRHRARPAGRPAQRRGHRRRRRYRAGRAAQHRPQQPRLLLEIQQRETERTGITSLKIAFNNVFGYLPGGHQQVERPGAARMDAQTDHRQRRALHHRGTERYWKPKSSAPKKKCWNWKNISFSPWRRKSASTSSRYSTMPN